MERLDQKQAGWNWKRSGGLGLAALLALAATGCRSTKPEVPPGRGFAPATGQTPPVNFSTQPNMNALNNLPGTLGTGLPGGGQMGTPMPGNTNPYGAPTTNGYGPPGSAGLSPSQGAASGAGLPPGLADPIASPASAPAAAQPGAGASAVAVPTPNPF